MAMLEPFLSEQVLDGFYIVYHEHGFGFLEGVYSNSIAVELRSRGLAVQREVAVEVKATKAVTEGDTRQLLNYLRASRLEVGYLLHFGPMPAFRRMIYTNDRK
jgi:hypothetical protein